MVASVGDPRREHDVADSREPVFQRARELGVGFDQRPVAGSQDFGRIAPVEQRPIGAVDTDDFLGLDPVPERQPAIIGEDRRGAAADPRGCEGVSACGRMPGARCGFQ